MRLAIILFCVMVLSPFYAEGATFKKRERDGLMRAIAASQNDDGSYGKCEKSKLSLTCSVVRALALSHRKYRSIDGPFMSKAIAYIIANQKSDGGIYSNTGRSIQETALAILALKAIDFTKYEAVLRKAEAFVESASPSGGEVGALVQSLQAINDEANKKKEQVK